MMLCSLSTTVDTKYPSDHTTPSFQYAFPNHANFFLNILALRPFVLPMTSLTEYLGGMIITAYM